MKEDLKITAYEAMPHPSSYQFYFSHRKKHLFVNRLHWDDLHPQQQIVSGRSRIVHRILENQLENKIKRLGTDDGSEFVKVKEPSQGERHCS